MATRMADPVERLVRVRLAGAGRSTTTGRLAALAALTVVALGLLFGSLALATAGARDALRVIGHDAGPQAVATTDLYFALSDTDAQLANLLLVGGERAADQQAARERYEQRRRELGTALLQAHRLAADSPAEQRTIASILDSYGRYEQLAARALLLAEQADYPAGSPPPEPVLDAYRQATDLMSYQVLPQAYNLTLENGTTVRRTHDAARSTVLTGRSVAAASGTLALACLVWLQVYLRRRFRRVFGPALMLATVVTGLYAYTGVVVLDAEAGRLDTAKHDGFDAVLSLARARAVSNSLHADQVRYLVDRERADTYEQIYLDKAQSLVYVEAGNLATYHAGVAGLAGADPPPSPPGLLGSQAGAGPRGATALAAFDDLQRADRALRAAAVDGDGEAAVAIRFGRLGTAFADYDAAVVRLTDQHQARFEAAVARGEDAIADLGFLLPVAMVSIAVLVVAGVAPRVREYR
jgi:hypothetical protein